MISNSVILRNSNPAVSSTCEISYRLSLLSFMCANLEYGSVIVVQQLQ